MLPTARFVPVALATCLVAAPSLAGAPPASLSKSVQSLDAVERVVMPPMDNAALLQRAQATAGLDLAPYQFAESITTSLDSATNGAWEQHDDGTWTWRLRLHSPGAVRLAVTFSQFQVPEGAALWTYDPSAANINGPYSGLVAGDRWTPSVPGDELIVELHVPSANRAQTSTVIGTVHHGFRGLDRLPTKDNGTCNIDTICSEGNPWRDQIRSVARMEFGNFTCSGQLVNNTNGDSRPLFLTANHCFAGNYGLPPNPTPASTLRVCFNYQSAVCGARNGTPVDCLDGSTFLAAERDSDFMLLELDQDPPSDFDVHFVGWERTGQTPTASVGIHHPGFREKALCFDDNPLTTDTEFFSGTHWRAGDWEDGTTEGGSSGSCIYNSSTGRCIGVLTGGFAGCSDANPTPTRTEDYYGKLDAAWNGDGTPSTRLRDWLDPGNTGAMTLGGIDPGINPNCVPGPTTACLVNGRFRVEVDWQAANGSGGAAQVFQGFDSDLSTLFHFGNANNLEILIKMLDACDTGFNSFWVFAAATTNVQLDITVRDSQTGSLRTYTNPLGTPFTAVTDTEAFMTCP